MESVQMTHVSPQLLYGTSSTKRPQKSITYFINRANKNIQFQAFAFFSIFLFLFYSTKTDVCVRLFVFEVRTQFDIFLESEFKYIFQITYSKFDVRIIENEKISRR